MRKFWLAALLLPAFVQAQTAYVTDILRLNVYATPDFSGRPLTGLMSGDGFEVLSRDRLATQVRLPDGTEGFVRTAYIVDERPARLIVSETQAQVEQLTEELAQMRAAFEDPAAEISALNQRVASLTTEVEEGSARNAELESQLASLRQAAESYANTVPLTWALGALLAALIGGFLAGLKYVDHQIRKRHGGIRVL